MMLYFGRLLTCDKEAITIRVDMDGTCWIGDTLFVFHIDKVYLRSVSGQPANAEFVKVIKAMHFPKISRWLRWSSSTIWFIHFVMLFVQLNPFPG